VGWGLVGFSEQVIFGHVSPASMNIGLGRIYLIPGVFRSSICLGAVFGERRFTRGRSRAECASAPRVSLKTGVAGHLRVLTVERRHRQSTLETAKAAAEGAVEDAS